MIKSFPINLTLKLNYYYSLDRYLICAEMISHNIFQLKEQQNFNFESRRKKTLPLDTFSKHLSTLDFYQNKIFS